MNNHIFNPLGCFIAAASSETNPTFLFFLYLTEKEKLNAHFCMKYVYINHALLIMQAGHKTTAA